jgi:hypothetical protein
MDERAVNLDGKGEFMPAFELLSELAGSSWKPLMEQVRARGIQTGGGLPYGRSSCQPCPSIG